MKISNLHNDLDYLFNYDFFFDNFDPEDHEEHLDFSKEFLSHYPWEDIYSLFYERLTTRCVTADSVYNYINLFVYYGFVDKPVPNPYDLIGYVFYRIDVDKYWDKYGDFVDSFTTSVLENAGELDLMKDPYYQPWRDPKIEASVMRWKANVFN